MNIFFKVLDLVKKEMRIAVFVKVLHQVFYAMPRKPQVVQTCIDGKLGINPEMFLQTLAKL